MSTKQSKTKQTKSNIKYPIVKDQNEIKETLQFTLHNTDVSVANALRRTILSDIEVVVCDPYKTGSIKIYENTTKLNNEIIKQRLGCIPIHITDLNMNIEDLVCEINKKNEETSLDYVTTKDIKVKLKSTGKYISENEVKKIFPPDKLTNDYILINRLKPHISKDLPGEILRLDFTLTKGTAGENGMFNCACTCGYGNTGDKPRQNQEWDKIEKQLQNKYKNIDEELVISKEEIKKEIEYEKINWFNHHSKRIFKKNSFDFMVESVGVFSNTQLVIMACNTIMQKLKFLADNVSNSKLVKLEYGNTTIENSVDIHLYNENYTISKILEYIFYEEYFKKKTLSYVGSYKRHPHDHHMILRLGFVNEQDNGEENIRQLFKNNCLINFRLFEKIKTYFE